jgi:hypothetical protein
VRLVAKPRRPRDGYSVCLSEAFDPRSRRWGALCIIRCDRAGEEKKSSLTVMWKSRSAQSIVNFLLAILMNHSELDRKPTDAIARIDTDKRSTSPPIGLRGALSA